MQSRLRTTGLLPQCQCAYVAPGELIEMQNLIENLWGEAQILNEFLVSSSKFPGDADAIE